MRCRNGRTDGRLRRLNAHLGPIVHGQAIGTQRLNINDLTAFATTRRERHGRKIAGVDIHPTSRRERRTPTVAQLTSRRGIPHPIAGDRIAIRHRHQRVQRNRSARDEINISLGYHNRCRGRSRRHDVNLDPINHDIAIGVHGLNPKGLAAHRHRRINHSRQVITDIDFRTRRQIFTIDTEHAVAGIVIPNLIRGDLIGIGNRQEGIQGGRPIHGNAQTGVGRDERRRGRGDGIHVDLNPARQRLPFGIHRLNPDGLLVDTTGCRVSHRGQIRRAKVHRVTNSDIRAADRNRTIIAPVIPHQEAGDRTGVSYGNKGIQGDRRAYLYLRGQGSDTGS